MAFVSVTRLRIRSWRYMLPFAWRTMRSARQVQASPGYLNGAVMREPGNVFWTMTVWQDEPAMKSYRTAGPHRQAMPKLLDWCDEASVVHWSQESAEPPPWAEAHRRMIHDGRLSKVRHPSPAQIANKIPVPKPTRQQTPLPPIRRAVAPLN